MSTIDILKAAGICSVAIAATLVWLYFSRQKLVIPNLQAGVAIAIRIVLVHVVFVPVLCIGGGIPVDYLAIPALVILVFAPLVTLETVPELLGDSALSMAIGATAILPLYVIKQFVLGFPDRSKFVLEPPIPDTKQKLDDRLMDSLPAGSAPLIATVVAPLKPFGYVELNGERLSASSVSGAMIDSGQQVRVCGRKDQTLLVEQHP